MNANALTNKTEMKSYTYLPSYQETCTCSICFLTK